jgi:hypothetical protein
VEWVQTWPQAFAVVGVAWAGCVAFVALWYFWTR